MQERSSVVFSLSRFKHRKKFFGFFQFKSHKFIQILVFILKQYLEILRLSQKLPWFVSFAKTSVKSPAGQGRVPIPDSNCFCSDNKRLNTINNSSSNMILFTNSNTSRRKQIHYPLKQSLEVETFITLHRKK